MQRSSTTPTVLHFVETFLERSETFIHSYISAHRNWNPVVLTVARRNEKEFAAPAVHVVSMPVTKRDPAWWSSRALEVLTGRSSWHRCVEAFARELQPQVMHAHFGHKGFQLLPVARRLATPLVTTFYGYDMSVLPKVPGWQRKFDRLFDEGRGFLVEGPCMRHRLIALGAPADKVAIQRIAIDPTRYPAWAPGATPCVLFVGRMVEKKGLRYLVEAFRLLAASHPALRLRVVGDGPERPALEAGLRRDGLGARVDLLGMLPHAQVIAELERANVFVQPSVTASNGDTEGGAPTILLEAQAVGVPLVATRHADIPNVVDPDDPGVFLVSERDAGQLAEAIGGALARTAPVSRRFVHAHHDVRSEVGRLESFYESCLGPVRSDAS